MVIANNTGSNAIYPMVTQTFTLELIDDWAGTLSALPNPGDFYIGSDTSIPIMDKAFRRQSLGASGQTSSQLINPERLRVAPL